MIAIINRIEHYKKAYDVLWEHEEKYVVDLMLHDEDRERALAHLEDNETVEYMVLNGETVVAYDSLNGDIYSTYNTIKDFRKEVDYALDH